MGSFGAYSQCIVGPDCLAAYDTLGLASTEGEYRLSVNNAKNIFWSVKGDLEIVSVSGNDGEIVNVRSVPKAQNGGFLRRGEGKGKIEVTYLDSTSTICGSKFCEKDIFKTYADEYPIVGPVCISSGDTVTYSVQPVASVNLFDEIGIDRYLWRLPDGLNDTILYYSADSSSITFVVGNVSGGEAIEAEVGQKNFANNHVSSLTLEKALTEPDYLPGMAPPTSCLSVTEDTLKIAWIPEPGARYRWAGPSDWIVISQDSTSTTVQQVTYRINGDEGDLVLTASGGCTEDLVINYSIARELDTLFNQIIGPDCVIPGGPAVTYQLYDNVKGDLAGVKVEWEIPNGWVPNTPLDQTLISVTPNDQDGVVSVKSKNCPNIILKKSIDIAPLPPDDIDGPTCIVNNSSMSFTYSINPVPNAIGYQWSVLSGDVSLSSNTGTSVMLTPNSTNTAGNQVQLSVTAEGCQSSAPAILEIDFIPDAPDVRVSSVSSCIPPGDPVIFTVNTQNGTIQYDWNVVSGFGSGTVSGNQNQFFEVTPLAGSAIGEVEVRALGCVNSDFTSVQLDIANDGGNNFDITELVGFDFYTATPPSPVNCTNPRYAWTIIRVDGTSVPLGVSLPGVQLTGINALTPGDQLCVAISCDECVRGNACLTKKSSNGRITGQGQASFLGMEGNHSISMDTEKIKISPNPVVDRLDITLHESMLRSGIALMTIEGKMIKVIEADSQRLNVDVSDLAKGTYILLLFNGAEKQLVRFIKE
ncbi:MAG: T9SS type A sorting domain-containing protein [Bacteroidota bacterium]